MFNLMFTAFRPVFAFAFWPLVAQIGASLGGALLTSKLGQKAVQPNAFERSIMDAQMASMRRGEQLTEEAFPQGMNLTQQGMAATGTGLGDVAQASNYYRQLLSGNRAAMTSALGPELGQIADSYRAAAAATAGLTPRGGGRATLMGQLPFQQARDVSTLLQQARPQAAQGLVQTGEGFMRGGQLYAGAGSNLIGNALNALQASTDVGRTLLAAEAARRDTARRAGEGIGGWLQGVLDKVPWGSIGGGGKPTGGVKSTGNSFAGFGNLWSGS